MDGRKLSSNKRKQIKVDQSWSRDHVLGLTNSTGHFVKPRVRNLGVISDSDHKFHKQVNSVIRIKHFTPPHPLERIIHAFISSQPDYCNSIYLGIKQLSLSHSQLAQNVAARLLKKRSHHSNSSFSSLFTI